MIPRRLTMMVSTKYELFIRKHNVPAHLDIERDIKTKKDGLFTFTLRINGGNIVDYNLVEYVDVKRKYLGVKSVTFSQSTTAHYTGKRSETDTVRPDNL